MNITKSLTQNKINALIIVVALLIISIALLISFLPASYVLENEYVEANDLAVFTKTDGTLLTGNSKIDIEGIDGTATWDISALELFALKTVAAIGIKTNYGYLDGEISISNEDFIIDGITGKLSAAGFNKLIEIFGGGAEIYEGFEINGLSIKRSEGFFYYAAGKLSWDGGLIKLKNDKQLSLPAMAGEFTLIDNGVRLEIFEEATGLSLGQVDVSDKGVAHFKFLERFGSYIPMIPTQFMHGNLDAVMFQFKQEVFEDDYDDIDSE